MHRDKLSSKEVMSYGAILRYERELRGWSQQELVKRMHTLCAEEGECLALDIKTVGRWEREEHKPSSYYRSRLCQMFSRNAIQLGFIE